MNIKFIKDEDKEVEKYFNDIRKYPILTIEKERELYNKLNDPKVKDKIIKSNLRYVITIAKKQLINGLSLMDLISEGNIALMESYDKFNPNKGCRFMTFASPIIRYKILAYVYKNTNRGIKIPYNECYKNIKDDNIVEFVDVENQYTNIDEYDDLDNKIEILLSHLEDREKKIVKLYYGIKCKKMPLYRIANRLRISKFRACEIKNNAISKLKNVENVKILKEYL